MKLIIGLGNPGNEYVGTRHNAGFLVADELARQKRLNWEKNKTGLLQYCWFVNSSGKIELIKPQTFMNESGSAVLYAKKKHGVDVNDLYIVHDDLDIKLGEYKIQNGHGPKDHRGILDIEDKIGTKDFWRVRVGVDNRIRNQVSGVRGEDYVLQNFTDEEKKVLDGVIVKICKEIDHLLQ